ncbi:MAG: lipid A biosynthesis acyltransferase [Burkholderiaceae bacterium]|jgi:KDO2-lipid IV(A) lauroyltransferase|nr:lipid A biosynthesis acyltransferase [Burkholderiaceae bacterium]
MKQFAARWSIALMERAARWSPAARARLGRWIGNLLWTLAAPRRRITLTNLRLCFPELSESERAALGRRTFHHIARALVDHGVLATVSREDFGGYVRIEGAQHLTDAANRPLILIAPHFVGLDAGGLAVNTLVRGVSIYARSRNPEWDRWLLDIRNRFNAPLLIQREGFDLRAAVRALKDGLPFYYLPDQDPGERNGVFVPFFGVPTATLPMVPRLAKMAGAKVVMCVTEMTADGYVLHLEPPLGDYPSGDVEADTARMNAEIERWARRLPDQYLWTHKRFKTRPAGEPGVY